MENFGQTLLRWMHLLGFFAFVALLLAQVHRRGGRRWWPVRVAGPDAYTRRGRQLRLLGVVGTWVYVLGSGIALLASLIMRNADQLESPTFVLPLISLVGAFGMVLCGTYVFLSLGQFQLEGGRTPWWKVVPPAETISLEGQRVRAVVASLMEVSMVIFFFPMIMFFLLAG